jgi:hypothetical protein
MTVDDSVFTSLSPFLCPWLQVHPCRCIPLMPVDCPLHVWLSRSAVSVCAVECMPSSICSGAA